MLRPKLSSDLSWGGRGGGKGGGDERGGKGDGRGDGKGGKGGRGGGKGGGRGDAEEGPNGFRNDGNFLTAMLEKEQVPVVRTQEK